jgi:hypothetical protein
MEALTTLPRPILYTMSNYSPFCSAVAQLHTPEAIAYYKLRSAQDAQATLIATVKVGAALYEAAVMAYNLGAFVRALYESLKPAPEVTAIVVAQSTAIDAYEFDYDFDDTEVFDGEIVETAPALLLSAAPDVMVAPRTAMNQAWITANITPLAPVKALPAVKAKSAPTVSKAKKAPKAKPAGIAGRKSPTSVCVGTAIATID